MAAMRISFVMVHLLCASKPSSRASWLKRQCSVALASPLLRAPSLAPREEAGPGIADDAANVASAYAAFAKALPSSGISGGGYVVELSLPETLALVRCHGQSILTATRQTGSFLYRGEPLEPLPGREGQLEEGRAAGGNVYQPRAVIEEADLLDEDTYGSSTAAEYFRRADAVMAADFLAGARPSNAHIMVSNKDAAAQWGTACSVWPLGDQLDYSWLDNCSELWNPSWERVGGRSLPVNGNQDAFFWRDEKLLKKFFADGLRVNTGLPDAIRRGHEVLIRGGDFSLGDSHGQHVVRDAFVCIPASMDGMVRLALGVRSAKSIC